jgi:NADH:ubiquinone reductase (H+-translocating)
MSILMAGPLPRVVILGAGFGGLSAARTLTRAAVRITVIDRANHHLFQPLLYQVATAALSPADISAPIRRILRHQKNVEVLLAEATAIDLPARRVVLADGEVDFDFLIVATGATHAYFGHAEWERLAPGLKTLKDALQIRQSVLMAFEIAEREPDKKLRHEWMTFVIVGAGPTGVELAGTLAEVARQTLARDFRHIDTAQARVVLIEAAMKVLGTFDDSLSAKAQEHLKRLGVEVRLGLPVSEITAFGVKVGSEWIGSRTIIWAAGVAASPLARSLNVPLDRAGRVLVEPDLTVPGAEHVFVIGDLAHLEQEGKPVPGIAPAAMQEGRHAASNLLRSLGGQDRLPFHYHDKGKLATIGRGAAVAHIGSIRASGYVAWILWLFVHIFFLIGFRNRLVVMIQWAWSYITFDRGARLITEGLTRPLVSKPDRPEVDRRAAGDLPADRGSRGAGEMGIRSTNPLESSGKTEA